MLDLDRVLETSGKPRESIEVANFGFGDREGCIKGCSNNLVEIGIRLLSIGAGGDWRPVS